MSKNVIEAGVAAVQAASRLTLAVRRQMVDGADGRLSKEDRSPVTVADFGAQALVCHVLGRHFPQDGVVAEEDSAALSQAENAALLAAVRQQVAAEVGAVTEGEVCRWIDHGNGDPEGRYWVLDPIDGTKGFLRGDQYAVALALIENGDVTHAFLGCPALDHQGHEGVVLVAQRGAGARAVALDGTELGPVQVSTLSDPSGARLVESVESAHTNRGLSGALKEQLAISRPSVPMDSQAKYAAVARGEAEIYLRAPNPKTPDYREHIWDHAAGWLVVQEAGGQVSDVYGRPLDWRRGRRLTHNVGVLATNGALHDQIVAALSTLLPSL